jgi:hypothetical protein
MSVCHSSILPFLLQFFLLLVTPLKIEKIPPQGYSPQQVEDSCGVYDSFSSSFYIIGGSDKYTNTDSSTIYSYSLLDQSWMTIVPESNFFPEGFSQHYCYLTKERLVYVLFGHFHSRCYNDIFTFNLQTRVWGVVQMTGDTINGRSDFLKTEFIWNNTEMLAIYGGFTNSYYDSNLYL